MLRLGFHPNDTRPHARETWWRGDPAVDWDNSPAEAKANWEASGDKSGLLAKEGETPTLLTFRALSTAEIASIDLIAVTILERLVLLFRAAVEFPGYEWHDEKGNLHKGAPREKVGCMNLIADGWLRRNVWENPQLGPECFFALGRWIDGVVSPIEKKALSPMLNSKPSGPPTMASSASPATATAMTSSANGMAAQTSLNTTENPTGLAIPSATQTSAPLSVQLPYSG